MNITFDFSGQTAFIAGGGGGVGKAIAQAFGAAGAAVGIGDLNPDRAESVPEAIRQAGGQAIGVQGDVANRFQASNMIERTRDQFGRIHIAVNAVGAFQPTPLVKVDEWDLRRTTEVNMVGAYFILQLVSRVMIDEGGGVIVNIASSHTTLSGGAPYLATKAGILGLTRQAARELAPDGIRVNAVSPGNVSDNDLPTDDATNMLARPGTPADVAQAVLFLCSDAARFITGQNLNLDGGLIG